MCSHVPHHFIFHISPYFAPKLLTGVWGRPVAMWRSLQHMLWIWHVQLITPSTVSVLQQLRGKNTTTHTCMQTHAHTQKIYMDASCIWSLPSLSSCLKAPWEICKLADAQHCRSYSDPHTGLWLSHPTQTHKRRLTHRLSWRDVYEYLQFSTTHPHKNTPAPEWGWRCVKRKMLTCLLGPKLFLPLSQNTLSWA